jgi:hypothetical protein
VRNETGSPVTFVGTKDNAINISFLCFVCKRENRSRKSCGGEERERRRCVCVGHIKRQEYIKTLGCEELVSFRSLHLMMRLAKYT